MADLGDKTQNVNICSDDNTKLVDVIQDGSIYRLAVDAKGTLTVTPATNQTTIQLLYEKSEVPVKAAQYQEALSYTVPTGYDLEVISFDGFDGVNNGECRAVNKVAYGSFVTSTGVFTDGSSVTLPVFSTKMYLYITTLVAASNDTITITYKNQAGTAGRTATVIIKSNAVGERIEVPLQTGDYGFTDITNITQSLTQAGAFNVEGVIELLHLVLTTNGVGYNIVTPGVLIKQGEIVTLQWLPSNASSVSRRVSLVGNLVPR